MFKGTLTLRNAVKTKWTPVIGLEIHCQLKTTHKLFSGASSHFDDAPNSNVAFYDASLPGALPKINPEAVGLALKAALALDCKPNLVSRFDRKHYFYHDLPHGFQITQKYKPIAVDGGLALNADRRIGIQQIQLEQDTAKTMFEPDSSVYLVDLNRAGAPLIEIISDPNLRSAEEAAQYVTKLRRLLRCVGASDGDMEKGSLRIDVNVSVKPEESSALGTRCEIKNINSIRFMGQAIESEVARQVALLEAGDCVEQETRGYDPATRSTFRLRSKEDAPDYRYLPDPELPPLVLTSKLIQDTQTALPELPDAMQARLEEQYKLSRDVSGRLVGIAEHELEAGRFGPGVAYFEEVAKASDPKLAANWIAHELVGALTGADKSFMQNHIPAGDMAMLVDGVARNQLTSAVAKACLAEATKNGTSLKALLSVHLSDQSPAIDTVALAQQLIETHPEEVELIRKGNDKVIMRLIGQGMKATKGKANAKKLSEILRERLQAP